MTTMTTPQSFIYAHRGAEPRSEVRPTTYVVLDVRRIIAAGLALVGVLVVIVGGLFIGGQSDAARCRAVPVHATDAGHLAAQGWTAVTGETMVAPGCVDQAR